MTDDELSIVTTPSTVPVEDLTTKPATDAGSDANSDTDTDTNTNTDSDTDSESYWENPVQDPDTDPDQDKIDRVAALLEEFGFSQPILVNEQNEVLQGVLRYEAAKQLGYDVVPVVSVSDGDES